MTAETQKIESLRGGEFLIEDSSPICLHSGGNNDEQKLLSQAAREFVEKEITPKLDAIDDQEPDLVVRLLEKAGELGLLRILIPEQYGGLGEDFNTNTFIAMEMGSSHSFGVSYAAHTGIGTLPILYYGTEETKAKIPAKICLGRMEISLLFNGAHTSGSDALSAKTTAKLSEDGNYYILNGQKMWITNGGFADILITFAQVDGDKFTCFIIETKSEGFTRGKKKIRWG